MVSYSDMEDDGPIPSMEWQVSNLIETAKELAKPHDICIGDFVRFKPALAYCSRPTEDLPGMVIHLRGHSEEYDGGDAGCDGVIGDCLVMCFDGPRIGTVYLDGRYLERHPEAERIARRFRE